jgi:predicted DNA-binding transcriptional regulator AlpA
MNIDPLLPKQVFAEARGCSVRTIDRMVKDKLIPRGEPINGTAVGWRASMVNLTLEELEALAKAQTYDGAAEQEARAAKMREIGAKGGRRSRGKPVKAHADTEAA